MASLVDAMTALAAAACEAQSDRQFIAFPPVQMTMNDADLDAADPFATDYSVCVQELNMLPDGSPIFNANAHFVWDKYQHILADRVLANRTSTADRQKFDGLKSYFDVDSALSLIHRIDNATTGNVYYRTPAVDPRISTSTKWTKVEWDGDAIKAAVGRLKTRDALAVWAAGRNWLGLLGLVERVRALSFEHLSVVLRREWLKPELFTWRFWDLPGETLSSGGDPPSGTLPGYITELLLVRNVRLLIESGAEASPEAIKAAAWRQVVDNVAHPNQPAVVFRQVSPLTAWQAAKLSFDRSAGEASAYRVKLKAALGSPANSRHLLEVAAGEGRGFDFHVPPRIDHDFAPRLALLRKAVDECNAELSHISHGGIHPGLNQILRRMALQRARLALQHEILQLTELSAAIREHGLDRPDSGCYVLAYICDQVPKSPNPDPTLFAV